ncbi:MAG: M23 family metallopeptidase [Ignavibacteria bacterium]
MNNKYITIFLAGFDKDSSKRFKIPAYMAKYFYHYLTAFLLLVSAIISLSIVFFTNYKNVQSENSFLLGKIDVIQKQTEIIDNNKLNEKFKSIDEDLSDIKKYLGERGVKNNSSDDFNITPYSDYGVNIINYYHIYTKEIYETIRNVPLGYPYGGELSSGYGYRTNPFGGAGGEFHSGLDFKGDVGDRVTATGDGFIKSANWYGGYGLAVVIEHKFGYSTIYGHLSSVNVSDGQFVKAGDVIGFLGSTGRSTGPHLHYEIRKDGIDISPSEFLLIN